MLRGWHPGAPEQLTAGGYACIVGHTDGVIVARGGQVSLEGTCHGLVVNDGGRLLIDGTVDGPGIAHAGEVVVGARARFVCGPVGGPVPPILPAPGGRRRVAPAGIRCGRVVFACLTVARRAQPCLSLPGPKVGGAGMVHGYHGRAHVRMGASSVPVDALT